MKLDISGLIKQVFVWGDNNYLYYAILGLFILLMGIFGFVAYVTLKPLFG